MAYDYQAIIEDIGILAYPSTYVLHEIVFREARLLETDMRPEQVMTGATKARGKKKKAYFIWGTDQLFLYIRNLTYEPKRSFKLTLEIEYYTPDATYYYVPEHKASEFYHDVREYIREILDEKPLLFGVSLETKKGVAIIPEDNAYSVYALELIDMYPFYARENKFWTFRYILEGSMRRPYIDYKRAYNGYLLLLNGNVYDKEISEALSKELVS